MTYEPLNPDPHTWWVYLDWLRPLTDGDEIAKKETTRLDDAVNAWSQALKDTPWAVKILETAKRRRHYTEVRHENHAVSIQLEGAIVAAGIGEMDWSRLEGNPLDFRRAGSMCLRTNHRIPAQCMIHMAQCASRAPHTITLVIDEDGLGILFVAGAPYEVRRTKQSMVPVTAWFNPLQVVVGHGVGRLPVPREALPPEWTMKPPEVDDPAVPLRRPWPYYAYLESPFDADAAQAARDTLCAWAKRYAPGSLLALMDEDYRDTPTDADDGSVPGDVREAFDQAVAVIEDGNAGGDSGAFQAAAEAVFTAIYSAWCDHDVERRAKLLTDMLLSVPADKEKAPDLFGRSRWVRHEALLRAATWGRAMGLRRPVYIVPDRP